MRVFGVLNMVIEGEKMVQEYLRRNRLAGYFQGATFAG